MLTVILLVLAQAQAPAPTAVPASPAPSPVPAAGAGDRSYRIGAGDILRVAVYGYEDLTQVVVVQPEGSFVFPLIGSVPAAEATPAELEARIAARLSKGQIRDPKVAVSVQEYRSKLVFVVGELARPGTYPLAGETRLVEILSRAGPLSANAGSEVVVVRPRAAVNRPVLPGEVAPTAGGGKVSATSAAEIVRVDVREIQEGRLEKNVVLKPNDTVFVPQAARIYVSGEVRNPGAFAYSGGLTIRQAISLAGGFTPDAATRNARVIREVAGKPKTLKLKLDEPVQPKDTIVVGTRLF
jgi:polysaccharide export outer membrane protein